MEGLLLVPPDKAAILGRSMWKTRFVTLGAAPQPSPTDATPSRSASTLRLNSSLRQLKFGSWNVSQASIDQVDQGPATWISVYKHKGDHDPLMSYPLSAILSCSIQDYAYRKTSSVQPTLIVTVHHGDPKRTRHARRLSQTGSLTKSQLSTLLFRSVPSAPGSIRDWHQTLQVHMNAPSPSSHRDSRNNLSGADNKNSRPSSSTTRPGLPQSHASYASRTSSHPGSALSIRTTHTGVSSPKSSSPQNPAQQSFDPSSSSSPHSDRFHTASPLRPVSPTVDPSPPLPPPPPVSRETILDRAFKMNCIPGAIPPPAGETPMNSIARFEALMQDIEARRAYERRPSAIDERGEGEHEPADLIPASAQRALEYIASGQSPARSSRPSRRSRPASLALPSNTSIRSPTIDSQHPQRDRRRSSVGTTPSTSSINTATVGAATTATSGAHHKRLSLADFTRRLSSSSSVILARTTTTTTSSRSSGMSDVSFHCVGDDDLGGSSSGGIIHPAAAWSGISIPSSSSSSHRAGPGYGGGGGGGGGGYGYGILGSSPAGSGTSSTHHHHQHQHQHQHHRPQHQHRHASSGSVGNNSSASNKIACNRLSGGAFGI